MKIVIASMEKDITTVLKECTCHLLTQEGIEMFSQFNNDVLVYHCPECKTFIKIVTVRTKLSPKKCKNVPKFNLSSMKSAFGGHGYNFC